MRGSLMFLLLALGVGVLVSPPAAADAAISTRLGLDAAQARSLAAIESDYRREFAALRGVYNTQSRALRRARLANDSAEVARLTAATDELRGRLAEMRERQDARIVALLRDDQKPQFDAYVAERRQMVGSSRDERLFD